MDRVFLCKDYRMLVGKKPLIMGILNVTPDSFSDGGDFLNVQMSVDHAKYLIQSGADIIDVGGESTRPFSTRISLEEEIARVIPVIKLLSQNFLVPISVDTTKAEVADRALTLGASIVNDISSMSFDSNMMDVVLKHNAGVVFMHMRGSPEEMQLNLFYNNLIKEMQCFFSFSIEKAIEAGINRSSIILDPGIGFGKSSSHNLQILKSLHKFKKFDLPIMVGPSRKAFIKKTISDNFLTFSSMSSFVEIGTQATISASVIFGADIVRVHDVSSTYATIKLINGIKEA